MKISNIDRDILHFRVKNNSKRPTSPRGPVDPCFHPTSHFLALQKEKRETKEKKQSLRSKCYCFSHNRASRIQKFLVGQPVADNCLQCFMAPPLLNRFCWPCSMLCDKKLFNEEMREQRVKPWKNEKTSEWMFNTFNQWYENRKRQQMDSNTCVYLWNFWNFYLFLRNTYSGLFWHMTNPSWFWSF